MKPRKRRLGPRYRVTWQSWYDAKSRCQDPSDKDFPYYGGRGIRMCKRWQKFTNFLKDMGFRPEGMTLERLDNGRGYSPKNCTWASKTQQNRNRSNVRLNLAIATAIRKAAKDTSQRILADTYGISRTHVSNILAGKAWAPDVATDPKAQ